MFLFLVLLIIYKSRLIVYYNSDCLIQDSLFLLNSACLLMYPKILQDPPNKFLILIGTIWDIGNPTNNC